MLFLLIIAVPLNCDLLISQRKHDTRRHKALWLPTDKSMTHHNQFHTNIHKYLHKESMNRSLLKARLRVFGGHMIVHKVNNTHIVQVVIYKQQHSRSQCCSMSQNMHNAANTLLDALKIIPSSIGSWISQ